MRRIANPLKGVFSLPRVRIPASPPDTPEPWLGRAGLALLAAALALCSTPACVKRKMVVRADPPGAQVLIEGRRLPPSPHEVPFVWYGTRQVTLLDPDHRPATRVVHLRLPWYQYPILDLVSEFCIPWTIEDIHEVSLALEPWSETGDWDEDALLGRAEAFRGMP